MKYSIQVTELEDGTARAEMIDQEHDQHTTMEVKTKDEFQLRILMDLVGRSLANREKKKHDNR